MNMVRVNEVKPENMKIIMREDILSDLLRVSSDTLGAFLLVCCCFDRCVAILG